MSTTPPAPPTRNPTRNPTRDRRAEARARVAPITAQYPFEPHFLEQGADALHYLDEGPRDAAPLLFLHGNPTWSFYWRRPILALRDRFRCVAPDHMGCGLSDRPQRYEYRLERHIANVEALVASLDLQRITLVVHDWGGPIGMGFARRHPELIERLVILNTAGFRIDRLPLRLALCRIPLLGRLAIRGGNAFARGATMMAVARPLPPEVKRGLLLPYDSWRNRIATLAFVEDIPMREDHPSYAESKAIEEAVASFDDRPAVLIWGEQDWCFTPAMRERWQGLLPHAEVHRFEDASHYVIEDAPRRVVTAIEEFLAKHPLS
jgi:cis-3-alkyl-4-acyloxetan-2-one decarboxylase